MNIGKRFQVGDLTAIVLLAAFTYFVSVPQVAAQSAVKLSPERAVRGPAG